MIATNVAMVTVTVTAPVRYIEARCPTCQRRLVDMPHGDRITIRVRDSYHDLSGGVAVRCSRCKALVEVISG